MEKTYERYHPDMEAMHRGFRTQPCFVCRMVNGGVRYPENIIYQDDKALVVLDGYPRACGYTLVAPKEHKEQVTGDFTMEEYLDLQSLVYRVTEAVREEAGVEMEGGNLLSVNSNLGRPEEGVPEMVVLAFYCRHLSGEPRAGEECSDAGWFVPEKALGLVEAPQQRNKLRDALGREQGLRYRAYRTRPYEALRDEEI